MFTLFAQGEAAAGGLVPALTALGGFVSGGGLVAVVLIRWMFDHLKAKDDAHNATVKEMQAASLADAKEARERYQQLSANDHADTKELITALVQLMTEQRAQTAAITDLAGEIRAQSNVTTALAAEVKAWRKVREG